MRLLDLITWIKCGISTMTAWPESPTTMILHFFSDTPLSFHLLAVVHCQFTVGDLYDRYHDISYASVVMWMPPPACLLRREASGLDIGHPPWRRCRRRPVHTVWIIGLCWIIH